MKQDVIEPGATYHIFNRGNNLENIFIEEKNYDYFLSLVKKYLVPVADIYAYCLLKNHFHFVLRIKDDQFLEDKYRKKPFLAFSHTFNAYTKAINKEYNRKGSLFQEHLHRIRVKDEKYLKQLIAYVHLNPVKHKFAHDHKSYLFSSFHEYSISNSEIISSEFIFELFDGKSNFEYWHDLNRIYLADKIDDI
jgi:putative transposase